MSAKNQNPTPETGEITQKEIQSILAKFSFLENNFNPNSALSECFLRNRLKVETIHSKQIDGLLEGIKKKLLESEKVTNEQLSADKALEKKISEKFQNAVENSKAYLDFLEEKVKVNFYKISLEDLKGSTYHSGTLNSISKYILIVPDELDQ